MVKCIRISVIDIGVKSPKAGIAHPSGVPKFILGFVGVSLCHLQSNCIKPICILLREL
jgi:hypothetical protein